MPICIAGMHRSGTSMVTRLLNLCGLYLGEQAELMPATPDNPEGYWENYGFYGINNEILECLHSGWDLPPRVAEGWEMLPELDDLRVKPGELVQRFDKHGWWGWKDPRNALTLPFWKSLIPDLKVILCIRNPLEVAQSLRLRNGSSVVFGLNLWQAYNQRVLTAVPRSMRVVTHYDVYFHDAEAELRRVLGQLNVSVADSAIANASTAVLAGLHHNRATLQDLLKAHASYELIELYKQLCEEAGQTETAESVARLAEQFERVSALSLKYASAESVARLTEQFERVSALSLKSTPADTRAQASPVPTNLPRPPLSAQTDEYEFIPVSDYVQSALHAKRADGAQVNSRELELRALLFDLHEQVWKRDELIGVMRHQIRPWQELLDQLYKQIDQLRQELGLTYEQIRRMQATKVWQLGLIYWRILALLQSRLHP
jgi:hypothetical protein